jgi:hypothetical protein
MEKTLYILITIALTTVIFGFSITYSHVAAQGNSQGTQSGEQQGIPGPQKNANPLTQAPITGLEVRPPNNTTNIPPIMKGNLTGTLR